MPSTCGSRLLNTFIYALTSIKLITVKAIVSGTELGIHCMATIMDTVPKRGGVVMPSVIRSGRPGPHTRWPMTIYRITNTAMIKIFQMPKPHIELKSFKMIGTIVACRSTWANLVSVVVMVAFTPSGIAPSSSAKQSLKPALSPPMPRSCASAAPWASASAASEPLLHISTHQRRTRSLYCILYSVPE